MTGRVRAVRNEGDVGTGGLKPAVEGTLFRMATPTLVSHAQPLPDPRGPLSEALHAVLVGAAPATGLPRSASSADPYGEDLQLALHLAYELHYRPIAGVEDDLEWDPDVLAFRRGLETPFLAALREEVEGGDDVDAVLAPLLAAEPRGTGPSWHLARDVELWQLRDYVAQRSVYHLKEADPQSWVVPRLSGEAKAAFVTVQHDEYGAGRGDRMHSALFATMMRELDLNDAYGAYSAAAPAATLAPVNLMSMTGLHRSLLGAAVGHFIMIEVTSSPGSRRLSTAFRRLDAGSAGQHFYDDHVEADAVHEQVLRRHLLSDLLRRSPQLAVDVVLGVQASLLLEGRFGEHLMAAWAQGRTAMLRPLD